MLKLAMITDQGFPSGMATTNRNLTFIKGLEESGSVLIKVYCVRATEIKDNIINKSRKGVLSPSTSFFYTSNNLIWPTNKITKLFSLFKSNVLFAFYFIRDHRLTKYNIIMTTTESYFSNLMYFVLSKITGVKFILAIDEYPRVIRYQSKLSSLYKTFYIFTFFKFFDSFIIMTNTLVEYYKKYMKKKSSFIKVPMTVDSQRFTIRNKENKKEIVYCGNLGLNQKDGVPILIKAFAGIVNKYPEYKLIIIGGVAQSDNNELLNLKKLVSELNIDEKVVFTGVVSREEIPKYLSNASILALARPDSLQAQGGFPTKLGEYLSTGNPVVVTKVGEIPDYLTDGVSGYLAEPNSVESFKEKLFEAIESKNSKMVGENGKQLVYTIFDYKVQGRILYNHLLHLI